MALTKVTGSVIKDSVSLSGNVSIGGTLTYQDVTNVDAIGVITARSGIDAASNLLLKTGGNERLRISSNGLVNIGAGSSVSGLSPILHLHKNASSTAYLHITNNNTGITNNDGFLLGINAVGDCLVFNKDSTPIRFATQGLERLRILSTGRIGIGTDTATAKLEISDALETTGEEVLLKLQGRATKNVYLDINADANRRGVIRFKSAGTDKWSIGRGDSDEISDDSFFIATGNSGGNTTKLAITSSGKLLVGHTADIGNIRTQFNQNNQFVGATSAGIKIGSYANNAYASSLEFIKSRSATLGTNTLIQNGDTLGTIMWGAADGANYQPAAYVSAVIDGAPNTNDVPTRLSFGTAKDGAAGAGEKMRINPAGQIMIGDNTVGNSTNEKLIIQGMTTNDNYESSIALRRGSTISTGDAGLGYVKFQDSAGDTGAHIGGRADSGWSGSSRPTHLWFATVKSGSTSLTEACRITSGGYLQQHNLPVASYSDTRAISLSNTDLTGSNFYNYLWYISDSSIFDSSTGHFIAPVHGVYRLYFRCTTDNQSGNRANVRLRKNGNTRNEAYASKNSGSTNIQSVSSEIVDVLNAGEYMDIQVAQLHTQAGNQHKQVTFHMLG